LRGAQLVRRLVELFLRGNLFAGQRLVIVVSLCQPFFTPLVRFIIKPRP
jgi:hypothetical protein